MTDSVIPASLNSYLIVTMSPLGMVTARNRDSLLPRRLDSQSGSLPNIMKRLRWAAMRRLTWGESHSSGAAGRGSSLRSLLLHGRYVSSQSSLLSPSHLRFRRYWFQFFLAAA